MSLSWGVHRLQQLYSRLFTGKPAGGGPHDNKGLTPHSSSLSTEIWLWRERGWMTGGGGTLLPGEMRKWVLFLCGGPGVGLRGPHGRRAVGSAAAWPPALIWSLSNRGLIKLCRLCSTFTSLDVSLSARPLLYPVWCRIWPVWIRPGWTHSETHSCMIMLTGCDPPQWTACVWWAIRWYRMFSRFSGHREVSEPSEPDYRRLFFVCVGASSAFRVQIVVNKENKPDDYCLYQIVVFSVKWIVCLQTFWISCRAEIITFMSINH